MKRSGETGLGAALGKLGQTNTKSPLPRVPVTLLSVCGINQRVQEGLSWSAETLSPCKAITGMPALRRAERSELRAVKKVMDEDLLKHFFALL